MHWKTSLKMAATAMAEGNYSYFISPVFKTNHVEITMGNTEEVTLIIAVDSTTGILTRFTVYNEGRGHHFLNNKCEKKQIKNLMRSLYMVTADRYIDGENMENFELLYRTLKKYYLNLYSLNIY